MGYDELVQRAKKIEQTDLAVSAVSMNGMGSSTSFNSPESEVMEKLEELSTNRLLSCTKKPRASVQQGRQSHVSTVV